MYKFPSKVRQASLFWNLEAMLSPKNSLYKLATLIDWNLFEQSNTNHDSRHAKENGLTVHQGQEAQTLPQAGRNRACHRPLQGRSSIREELLQGSLRRLHPCRACSCRIQLQKSHEASFVPY